jgi:hypothetical protein
MMEIQLDVYTWPDSRYEQPEGAYGSHAATENDSCCPAANIIQTHNQYRSTYDSSSVM